MQPARPKHGGQHLPRRFQVQLDLPQSTGSLVTGPQSGLPSLTYAAVERARAKAREESWVQLEKAAAEQRQAAAVQRDLHIRFPSARARAHHMSSMKGKGKVADAPCHRDDFFTQDACGICMEGAAVVGYLPCRHLVACLSCQRTMGVHRPCPVCRSRIQSFKLVLAADVQAHAAASDVQPAA